MIDFSSDNPPVTSEERMVALEGLARLERKLGYVDESVAEAELPAPHFAGERYEAEVPDTLDLTEHAVYAINAYTRMLDPALDYKFIGNANFVHRPPLLILGGGYECSSKQLESLVLMRVMSGSMYNAEIDNKFIGSLLHITGHDGFCYAPWAKIAWQPNYRSGAPTGEDKVSTTRHPYASAWEASRQVLALCMWHQQSGFPLWAEQIEKKINRLRELAVWQDDYCYLARRFYLLSDKGPVEGPEPTGEWSLFDAMFSVAGLSLYSRIAGHEPALDLAGALTRRVMHDSEAYTPDGRWLTHHFHTNTGALIGLLEYATTINDHDLVAFVQKSYEFGKAVGEPLVGYYAEHVPGFYDIRGFELDVDHKTCETCEVADMLVLGVKLSRAGAGEYWEDVDRSIRNQFIENQITRTDWPERFEENPQTPHYRPPGAAIHLWEDPTDAVERAVGSWAGWARGNDGVHEALMQCCAGNAGRTMYYVWDSIVTRDNGEVRVNLHLNRASRWLDVDSHLPYEGKVVIKIKDAPRIAVRIPEWTDRDRVSCQVNGKDVPIDWDGNYITIESLSAGDQVVVQFPMRETTLIKQIAEVPYTLKLRGNTVVDIEPKGKIYPLYQREHMMKDKAPIKKVTRFVSSDTILW